MTLTTLDEPMPETATALYLVNQDGSVSLATDCVMVQAEVGSLNNVPADERFLMAHMSESAIAPDTLWWNFKAHS